MDYRELLKKYMAHVLEQEGTTFTGYLPNDIFSDNEKAVLEDIAEQL